MNKFEEIFGKMLVAAGLKSAPKPARVRKEVKKDSMQMQALIFSKDMFKSSEEAKRWAADHGFKDSKVDETENSYRLRQRNPGAFKTMRTISLTNGVKGVVGKAEPSSSDVHVPAAGGPAKKKKPSPARMMIEKQGGGIMVALYVPLEIAKRMVLPEGEKPEDMHITLVYVPGVGEDQKVFDKIAQAAKSVADRFDPIEVSVDGIDKFGASMHTDWKDVYYARATAPDLQILHNQLAMALAMAGVEISRKHSYVPHITLKYCEQGSAAPTLEPHETFTVDKLSIASKTLPVKHHALAALYPEEAKRPHPFSIEKEEISPEQLRAKASDLIVLPDEVDGTNCANCKYFGYDDSSDTAVCENPEVDQPVSERMCCALWDADGAERVWEMETVAMEECDPDEEECEDIEMLLKSHGIAWKSVPEDVRMALAALGSAGPSGFELPKRLPSDNTGASGAVEMALKALGAEIERTIPIFKADKTKQIVYGVVLEPDTVDAQEDVMLAEDIEEAAHKYLAESRTVGSRHAKPIKAVPVESYIAPVDFHGEGQYGNQIVKKGSWVLGVKVLDAREWAKVESGEYTGFSVGGVGEREQL